MANSTTVTADGVQTDFSVTFPFLDRAHVKVRLSGVLQSPPAYSWLTASSIRFAVPPSSGALVYISRETPLTPVTDFSDGATLDANSLDRALRQPLYLVEDLETGDTSVEAGAILADAYAYTNAREVAIRADFPTGGGGGASTAADVSIVDAGGHFVGATVEAALQEAGAADASIREPSYLVLANTAELDNERRLVAGTNITFSDGGPGGALTISAAGGGGSSTANGISISDSGAHFTSTNVEDALQEVGAGKANTNFDNVVLDGSIVEVNTTPAAAPSGKRGENIVATDASSTGGYSVRYAQLIKSGEHNDGSKDIGDTLIVRYNNVTHGSSWARWDVATSPLNPSSGLAGAPGATQRFYTLIGEANPQNRHSSNTWQGETRLYANPVGGWQMVAETQDFSGILGNKRVGYNCAFGYLISKSPYNCTENSLHATFNNGILANPNAISPQGAFLFASGHKQFPTAIAIANAGTGYTVGDKLTFNTGLSNTANEETVVEVVSVGGGGAITSARIYVSGWYQQTFAATVGVTGGSGTGATFTCTMVSPVSANIPRAWGGITGLWDYGIDGAAWNGSNCYMGSAAFLGGMMRAPNNNKIIVARNAADSADVTGLLFNAANQWEVGGTSPVKIAGNVGFYGTAPVAKPTVSGYVGSVSQQQSVVSALATLGLVTNSTTVVSDDMVNALQFAGVDPTGTTSSSTGLQSAINAAAGGTLVIPKGTYKIDATLTVPSNTTIIAYGASFIRSNTAITALLLNQSNGADGGYTANSNITILGGTWDSSTGVDCSVMAFGHCTSVTLRDVNLLNENRYHHIEVNACDDVLIENCKFTGGFTWATTVGTGYDVTLNEAIQIDGALNSGVFPWFGPYDNTACRNVTIRGCRFQSVGTGIGSHSEPPSGSDPHTFITVENCYFDTVSCAGIKTLSWSDVNIKGNRFQSCFAGIIIGQSTVRQPNSIQISHNSFYRLGYNTTNPPTAYYNSAGVWVSGAAGGSYNAKNVVVSDNRLLDGNGTNGQYGIVVQSVQESCVISGNSVNTFKRSGIYVYGSDLCAITGNVLKYCNQAAGSWYDIQIGNTGSTADTTRVTCIGNTAGTLGVSWARNSVIRNNNLYTSLTQANNDATAIISENLVVTTFA